jgi:hypothetical protein
MPAIMLPLSVIIMAVQVSSAAGADGAQQADPDKSKRSRDTS